MTAPPAGRLLSGFCRDCFLLARAARTDPDPEPPGRGWERAVGSLLWRPGLNRRQQAGTFGLFGRGSASGSSHEIDAAGLGPREGVWVEAKSKASVSRSDVAMFRLKCDDLYLNELRHDHERTSTFRWWPVLVSSEPVSRSVRSLCATHGIVLCDPDRLPLPVILKVAANPEADLHLREGLLSEAIRLMEPACRSMQERWQLSQDRAALQLSLSGIPSPRSISELLFVQKELSDDLLDYMDTEHPGALDRKGNALATRLRRAGEYVGALAGAS